MDDMAIYLNIQFNNNATTHGFMNISVTAPLYNFCLKTKNSKQYINVYI